MEWMDGSPFGLSVSEKRKHSTTGINMPCVKCGYTKITNRYMN
jgi:hypothetical protein